MDGVDIVLYAQVDCLLHPRPQVLNLVALIPAVTPHVRWRTDDVIIWSAATEKYNYPTVWHSRSHPQRNSDKKIYIRCTYTENTEWNTSHIQHDGIKRIYRHMRCNQIQTPTVLSPIHHSVQYSHSARGLTPSPWRSARSLSRWQLLLATLYHQLLLMLPSTRDISC